MKITKRTLERSAAWLAAIIALVAVSFGLILPRLGQQTHDGLASPTAPPSDVRTDIVPSASG